MFEEGMASVRLPFWRRCTCGKPLIAVWYQINREDLRGAVLAADRDGADVGRAHGAGAAPSLYGAGADGGPAARDHRRGVRKRARGGDPAGLMRGLAVACVRSQAEREPLIVWIGKIRRYRRCAHHAIKAMPEVVRRVPRARLVIAGRRDDEAYEEELRQLAEPGRREARRAAAEHQRRREVRAAGAGAGGGHHVAGRGVQHRRSRRTGAGRRSSRRREVPRRYGERRVQRLPGAVQRPRRAGVGSGARAGRRIDIRRADRERTGITPSSSRSNGPGAAGRRSTRHCGVRASVRGRIARASARGRDKAASVSIKREANGAMAGRGLFFVEFNASNVLNNAFLLAMSRALRPDEFSAVRVAVRRVYLAPALGNTLMTATAAAVAADAAAAPAIVGRGVRRLMLLGVRAAVAVAIAVRAGRRTFAERPTSSLSVWRAQRCGYCCWRRWDTAVCKGGERFGLLGAAFIVAAAGRGAGARIRVARHGRRRRDVGRGDRSSRHRRRFR